MGLRRKERCPLHNSFWCSCHKRAASLTRRGPQLPVEIIPDPHHPDGQREICSTAELRRRKHVLMGKHPFCFYCEEKFTEYDEVELAHKNPKGIGGGMRDDAWTNIALSHKLCNRLNGSKWATPRK